MRTSDYARNIAVGIASGLAAAFVMNRFQDVWGAVERTVNDGGWTREPQQRREQSHPATVPLADRISRVIAGAPVPDDKREMAGELVHYGFGSILGALYGLSGARYPAIRNGFGVLYGAGVWAIADEGMVPALGLSGPPQETPIRIHLFALASHLVFGAALETARRGLERALANAPLSHALSDSRAAETAAPTHFSARSRNDRGVHGSRFHASN